MVGVVGYILLGIVVAAISGAKIEEAFWGIAFGFLLYALAIVAISHPLALALGLNQANEDRLYFALFFGIPGLFLCWVLFMVIRGYLSR